VPFLASRDRVKGTAARVAAQAAIILGPMLGRLSYAIRSRWWRFRASRKVGYKRLGALGPGSRIDPPALIIGHERIRIGTDVVIHPGSFFSVVDEHQGRTYDAQMIVGDRVVMGFDTVVACNGRIEIGDDVAIAHRVFIGDTHHEFQDVERAPLDQGLAEPRPVSIGPRCFLGTGCAILPGVTLGEGAIVGANAVVTRDVPAHTLVAGVPAKPVRRWDGNDWTDARPERAAQV